MKRKHVGQRWALFLSAALLGLWLSACGGEITDPNELPPGQKEFTTEEMSNGNSFQGGIEDGASAAPNASAGESRNAEPDANKGAPSGRTGEVEEADLYRMSGNLLFYLNTYKGLTVFDVADPKQPKKVANLPVFGYPIEMFVNKNIVYALVRDALYMLNVNGKFEFHRRHVSQLVTIDISNPQAPVVLQRFDIKGQLREGVSRKIEDTVYVVSYTPRWYWWGWSYEQQQKQEQVTVYSFNVANPSNIQMVQQLDLLKETSTNKNWEDNGTQNNESSNFSNITLSATSNTLLVGEQWYHYKSSYNPKNTGSWCSRSQYENWQSMKINIVDISDPKGSIKLHTRFEYRGHMGDQFKQTYVYDETTKKGTYYGIFQRNEWKRDSSNCNSERVVRNTLVSVDISDGKNPVVLHTLDFGKPNETVRGSLYDPQRRVVYAITAVNTDPLYTISFADPKNLKVLSAIDGLSGDMNVFRFADSSKNFLMGIGRDTSSACTGFGDNARSTNIAVSIMDVRDLSKVRLVQRKCVAIQGASWVSSELNWNLDQAHKMLGMYSDKDVNLITLPVSYYSRGTTNGWWYHEYKSAIGIMRWDLSKYDETKDETQQNVLENIATMEHPKGSVKRTIIFKHQTLDRRMVLNLSDTHISMVDLGNLASPSLVSTFELAPYIRTVYRFGKHLIEQVNLGQGYDDYNEFRVKAIGQGNINDAPILASFKVGRIQSTIRWKNYLVLFRYYQDPNKPDKNGYPQYDYNKSEVVLYDLSNPLQPVQKGSTIIPRAFYPNYYFYCGWFDMRFGFDYYWYPYYQGSRGFITTGSGITSLFYQYDNTTRQSHQVLLMLDFTNPSKPSYQEVKLSQTNNRQHISLVPMDDNTFYVAHREQISTHTKNSQPFTLFRYYAERWTRNNNAWASSGNINLPGRLSKAWTHNGNVKFLTHDQSYILRKVNNGNGNTYDRYQQIFRLHLLEQSKDAKWAVLQSSQSFLSWQLKDMIVDGDRLYLNATRDWYYMQENKIEWYDRSDNLMIFDLSKNSFNSKFSQATRTSNMQLSGVQNNRLFIQLPGEGLLIADVSDASAPKGLHFERTLGWAQNVELSGDHAFIAAGHFGIYQVSLTNATLPPL